MMNLLKNWRTWAVIVAIAGAIFLINRPAPQTASIDLPAGTIYYKGPMKGKGGKTASDDLNADIKVNGKGVRQ
jgi:hypothetical protein